MAKLNIVLLEPEILQYGKYRPDLRGYGHQAASYRTPWAFALLRKI